MTQLGFFSPTNCSVEQRQIVLWNRGGTDLAANILLLEPVIAVVNHAGSQGRWSSWPPVGLLWADGRRWGDVAEKGASAALKENWCGNTFGERRIGRARRGDPLSEELVVSIGATAC
jgi:hypothetical protein